MMDPKQQFLDAYDRELATTLRVLRAFPADQAELRPHPKAKSARELAWVFVLERGLGQRVWNDELSKGMPGKMPEAPEDFHAIIDAYEKAAAEYRQLVAAASPDDLAQQVTFFTAPKTMGKISRMEWIWFLLHDEIHHRGQFSVYLRMADGKVPSIYGPSADEPWI